MNNTSPKSKKSFKKLLIIVVPWLAFVLVLSALLKLGFWQLSRAEQKEVLLEQQAEKEINAPTSLAQLIHSKEIQFTPLLLKGKWLKHWQFNLDNRIHNGITGYNLFSLFADESGTKIFVDRGWRPFEQVVSQVEGASIKSNRNFIFTEPRQNQTQVMGYAFQPLVYEVVEVPNPDINIVLALPGLNLPKFKTFFKQQNIDLAPFILRQNFPETEDGLVREWVIMTFPAERHVGYAVQWFSLALALVLIPVIIIFKRKKTN